MLESDHQGGPGLNHIRTGRLRISSVTWLATLAVCVIGGECAGEAQPLHRPTAPLTRQSDGATGASGLVPPPGRPAPMRYHGGPKSPMWRD